MAVQSDKNKDEIADFAIVIPVGPGHRPWLKFTLRSLAIQKCKVTVAVCAVDDSPDLHTLLADFQDIIAFVRGGDDQGQSDAINQGWTALEARYYGWLNDDDMLHPEALTRVLRAFEETNADVIHGRSDILEAGELRIGYGDIAVDARLLRENPIAQPSCFIKRSALTKICAGATLSPVDPNNHYAMDWDLWQRLYLSGASFVAIPDPLSITRWHTQTKTSRPSLKKYRDYARILKRGRSGPLRSVWTLVNFFIHNQVAYGRFPTVFKCIENALSGRTKTAGETEPVSPVQGVEVYHYHDAAQCITDPIDNEVLAPQHLAGDVLETQQTHVRLQPVTDASLD